MKSFSRKISWNWFHGKTKIILIILLTVCDVDDIVSDSSLRFLAKSLTVISGSVILPLFRRCLFLGFLKKIKKNFKIVCGWSYLWVNEFKWCFLSTTSFLCHLTMKPFTFCNLANFCNKMQQLVAIFLWVVVISKKRRNVGQYNILYISMTFVTF